MKFAVVWNLAPTQVVDDAWHAASAADQRRIVQAIETIDRLLSNDPLLPGESRQDATTRVLSYPPVTVHYRVIQRLQLVRVFATRIYRSI